MSEETPPQMPEDNDRPDWYEQGFDTLRQAENAWQCEAESRAEQAADDGQQANP